MDDILERATLYRADAGIIGVGHYQAAEAATRAHYRLGAPAAVLGGVVGTAIFATLQQQPQLGWRLLVGVTALVAAVLTWLHMFMNPSERAERHRSAAARYSALRRDLDLFLLRYADAGPERREAAIDELDRARGRLTELADVSPAMSKRIRKRADKWVATVQGRPTSYGQLIGARSTQGDAPEDDAP